MKETLRQKVFNAAEEIHSEGQMPTNQLIRQKLGKHSFSQIGPLFREWKEARFHLKAKDTPPELSNSIYQLGNDMWNLALEKVRKQYQANDEIKRLIIQELKAENTKLKRENQGFKEQLEDYDSDIYEDKISSLENMLAQKHSQLDLTLLLDEHSHSSPNLIPELLDKHDIEIEKFDALLQDVTNYLNEHHETKEFLSNRLINSVSIDNIVNLAYIRMLEILKIENTRNQNLSINSKLQLLRLYAMRYSGLKGQLKHFHHWLETFDKELIDTPIRCIKSDSGVNKLAERYLELKSNVPKN